MKVITTYSMLLRSQVRVDKVCWTCPVDWHTLCYEFIDVDIGITLLV